MKTKILIIALMTFSMIGLSQEESKTFYGYGGPLIQVPQINGDWGIMVGGKGGMAITNKIVIGGIGMGLVHSNEFLGDDLNGNDNTSLNLSYGAGGVFIEYFLNTESPVRFSIPVNLMGGGVTVKGAASDAEVESSGVFIFEPGVNIEFKVLENFTPALNFSYRLALGSSLENLSNADISGISFGLTFKFGKY